MYNDISGGHLALQPGMEVTLNVEGFFTRQDTYKFYNKKTRHMEDKTLIRGFFVEDEEVGEITENPEVDGASVIYKHKKSLDNNVWFIARTEVNGIPEKGLFRIIAMPVHDHASVTTGGPAYATYYSEGYRDVAAEEGT